LTTLGTLTTLATPFTSRTIRAFTTLRTFTPFTPAAFLGDCITCHHAETYDSHYYFICHLFHNTKSMVCLKYTIHFAGELQFNTPTAELA
jgi:hypothetical protein